jgi:hypothetical protein
MRTLPIISMEKKPNARSKPLKEKQGLQGFLPNNEWISGPLACTAKSFAHLVRTMRFLVPLPLLNMLEMKTETRFQKKEQEEEEETRNILKLKDDNSEEIISKPSPEIHGTVLRSQRG